MRFGICDEHGDASRGVCLDMVNIIASDFRARRLDTINYGWKANRRT